LVKVGHSLIAFAISGLGRAVTLQRSDDRQVFQTSPSFIAYCNELLGKLDKGKRLEF
jgi:hypothetical protein